MKYRPIFTFSTSIGITVQVVEQINDVPLRGLFFLEIDPDCIANDVILSLTKFEGTVDEAELKAMDMCSEIEMMALEMSRERLAKRSEQLLNHYDEPMYLDGI